MVKIKQIRVAIVPGLIRTLNRMKRDQKKGNDTTVFGGYPFRDFEDPNSPYTSFL